MPRSLASLVLATLMTGGPCLPSSFAAGSLPASAMARTPILAPHAADVESAVAAMPTPSEHGVVSIAANVPLAAGLESGVWTSEGDTETWRLRLRSDGAKLLIAHLDELVLPEGAELRYMSADGSVVHGPYTAHDGRPGPGLWTPFVKGDEAVLELRVPRSARESVRLHLAEISHGTTEPMAKMAISPKSGTCNVDVACSAGDNWRDEIRSVGLIQIPFGNLVDLCTGTLMNNVQQDGTPYFLTADHCGITAANAGSVTVFWNFQTATCGGSPTGNENFSQTTQGATFMAHNVSADYTLIRLSSVPPVAYNVHYAGFDASGSDVPECGAVIHHPSSDEKRISLFSTSPSKTTIPLDTDDGVDRNISAFEVHWSRGVTEQGSSGSALLNESRQVIGVLSGGTSSCSRPTEPDYFGRLEVAWTSGLKTYLDPRGTGTLRMCGRDRGSPCNPAVTVTPACGSGAGSGSGGTSDGGGTSVGGGDTDSGGGGGGGGSFGFGALGALFGAALLRRRKRP